MRSNDSGMAQRLPASPNLGDDLVPQCVEQGRLHHANHAHMPVAGIRPRAAQKGSHLMPHRVNTQSIHGE